MGFEANRPVKTTVRTFDIIENLSQTEGIRISNLVDQVDASKSIVHNHLSTLRELGYVRKIGEEYQLSSKLLSTGFEARKRSRLFGASHTLCSNFANSFNTGVVLCEQTIHECIVTDVHNLTKEADITVGKSMAITESLPGLVAIIADSDRVIPDSSNNYNLTKMCKSVAEQGYAIGPITPSNSLNCIGLPITDENDNCYGVLSTLMKPDIPQNKLSQLTDSGIDLRIQIENRLDSSWQSTRSFGTVKNTWYSQ